MKLLAFITDAYGGHGGIAKFNRDMLAALAASPSAERIVALPRRRANSSESPPRRVEYISRAGAGRIAYVREALRATGGADRWDGVVCGHIHLLPIAWAAARRARAPLLLVIYGVEAWRPTPRPLVNHLAAKVDAVLAISETTMRRFLGWAPEPAGSFIVPCCVAVSRFGTGRRRRDLVERYGLGGRRVLATVGRLAAAERYKGIDEVLEVLPDLAGQIPDLAYMVVGDGDDRPRLERKARELGLSDRVVFTGYVPESAKADHYRVADVFVMPGRGEGFGIVYLEALASGLPVIASSADGSREAVRDGQLGIVVDPDDPDGLKAGIREALRRGRGRVPRGLDYFSEERYRARWRYVVGQVFSAGKRLEDAPFELGRRPGHRRDVDLLRGPDAGRDG